MKTPLLPEKHVKRYGRHAGSREADYDLEAIHGPPPNKAQPRKVATDMETQQTLIAQAETTRAINLRQHLDGALGEIQHLRSKIYTLTDERAKFARKSAHADKLAAERDDLAVKCQEWSQKFADKCKNVAQVTAHADKLAEALRESLDKCATVIAYNNADGIAVDSRLIDCEAILRQALADYERSAQ